IRNRRAIRRCCLRVLHALNDRARLLVAQILEGERHDRQVICGVVLGGKFRWHRRGILVAPGAASAPLTNAGPVCGVAALAPPARAGPGLDPSPPGCWVVGIELAKEDPARKAEHSWVTSRHVEGSGRQTSHTAK